MLYKSADDWDNAPHKRVMLFGMSGLGKTYLSEILRANGNWFHYSVDYRIGTRYMGEHIADNFKREAMKVPFLAELLRSDAIYIGANLRFSDLSALSTYLGKPGDISKGGIEFPEFLRRQRLHRAAEISAMKDTVYFQERAQQIYNYQNFICDTSGSVVEVVDAADDNDPVLSYVSQHVLPVWIEGGAGHNDELVRRFQANPKPIYYPENFLIECWERYLDTHALRPEQVDPDAFIVWGYRQLMEHRLPRYRKIAQNWGVTIQSEDVSNIRTEQEFNALVSRALRA
ncbi:ATPase [Amylibacter marinus]|nr:ATPase [Amylibacter marinus]